jgi:CDP-glucose 4,6-dehydratase
MENMVTEITADFWPGRKVLLTGATGFKGSWLAIWLTRLGATVTGLGLAANQGDLFLSAALNRVLDVATLDVRDRAALTDFVKTVQPEIIFHLAAQPLVRMSYECPVETFETNVMGTVNLLDACRGLESLRTIVAITTDKVYDNIEHVFPYREDDHLGGHDPYSASKAACEIAIQSYRKSFLAEQRVGIASARAGNVIGGGDWSQDRLLPDAVRAWSQGQALRIRRPDAIRPWQHVIEPLAAYLRLAERLTANPMLAGAYNFGPHTHEAATVETVIEIARKTFGGAAVQYGNDDGPHEARFLTLETAKARSVLGVAPNWTLEQSIERTMRWYQRYLRNGDAYQLCTEDLDAWQNRL